MREYRVIDLQSETIESRAEDGEDAIPKAKGLSDGVLSAVVVASEQTGDTVAGSCARASNRRVPALDAGLLLQSWLFAPGTLSSCTQFT